MFGHQPSLAPLNKMLVNYRGKYANDFRPVIIDTFNNFFQATGWITGETSLTTTLSAQPTVNSEELNVVSSTGLVVNCLIIVNNTDTYIVKSISGGTLTVNPNVKTAYPIGTEVKSVWMNEFHPNTEGYLGLGKFIANAKRIEYEIPSYNFLGAYGDFETTYTDANGEPDVPTGWVSIDNTKTIFGADNYIDPTTTTAPVHVSKGTKNISIVCTNQGAGMKTKDNYKLRPGYYVLRGDMKLGQATGSVTISVCKASDDSAVFTYDLSQSDSRKGALKRKAWKFQITTYENYYIKIVQTSATAATVYLDNLALYRAYEQDLSDRYVFENPGNEKIVWFGDSWVSIGSLITGWKTELELRTLHSVIAVNAGTGGDKASNLVARIVEDVLTEKPYMCVINVGVNDAVAAVTVNDFVASYDTIIQILQNNLIIPVILTVPPLAQAYESYTNGLLTHDAFNFNAALKNRY